tara:strand:- start:14156 stop:15178 length:1023 start_codon:yes stop_codon:yes gene_type:complete
MLSFKDFKNTATTFEKLYADAFEYGFSSNDTESDFCFQSHKISKVLDKKSNILQCNLTIDVNRVLYGRKQSLNKLEVDYIEDEVVRKKTTASAYSCNFNHYVSDAMDENKIVAVSLDVENYSYCTEEKEYSSHAILMILLPTKKNSSKNKHYKAVCFNSHGGALERTTTHSKKLKKGFKETTLAEPLDFIIIKKLISSFEMYCNKNKITNQTIAYDTTNAHNYLGVNLQVYDDYGCCFIYPILFSLVFYLQAKPTRKKNASKSIAMIENEEVDLFVYKCLAEIDERIHKHIDAYNNSKDCDLDDLEDMVDEHLDKCKDDFIKCMMIKVFKFVQQPFWERK